MKGAKAQVRQVSIKKMPFKKAGKPTPIVNDAHFSDSHASAPKIGSPNSTFNPGSNSGALPTAGPPKYVQVPGKKIMAKGLTNKRITGNI